MKKQGKWIVVFLFLAVLFCVGRTEEAQAASYRKVNLWGQSVKVGKYTLSYVDGDYRLGGYLYATKGKTKKLLAHQPGLSSIVLTDGSHIYYYASYDQKAVVYQISVSGKSKKKIFSLSYMTSFTLEGYYGGKLYYVKELDPGKFCSYTIRNGKKKTIKNNVTTVSRYKNYFYLQPYEGGGGLGKLSVYNAKNGKVRSIANKYASWRIISGKYLYYVEYKTFDYMAAANKIKVRRCSLGGTGKKTLVSSLTVQRIIKLTKNSIRYVDVKGKTRTKKF